MTKSHLFAYKFIADRHGEKFISYWYYALFAMNYIRLGRNQEARKAAAEVKRLFPAYSLEWGKQFSVYKDPAHLECQHGDLRIAGLSRVQLEPISKIVDHVQ